MVNRHYIVAPLVALILGLWTGCGGGSSAPAATPIRFSVGWGARSRVVEARSSALSAVLTLKDAARNGGDMTVTVNRGATPAANIQNVVSANQALVGTWNLEVQFYALADGAGDLVGSGTAQVAIAPDGAGINTVAINWRIASIEIAPNQSVKVGETKDLTFTARDAQNALIAVTPGSALWQVTIGTDRMRFTEGRAVGLLPGAVTASVAIDGVTATQSALVTSDTVVQVTPASPTLSIRGSQTFTANVTGTTNAAVTWTVEEGVVGGSITNGGVYTAPAQPGVYHVRATSVYDPAKVGRATVTVQAGNASVIIQ